MHSDITLYVLNTSERIEKMDSTEIKVSVVVITYNHEKYVRHALQSIVSQSTNFNYEVIVGDDCSTDNTSAIVMDFSKKNPELFIPVIRDKNLGMAKNVVDLVLRAKGKYIALLEGDDYWLDDYKLQKQVDFMESHSDYAAVYGRIVMVDEKEELLPDLLGGKGYTKGEGEYTIKDFENGIWPGHTATSLFRKASLAEIMQKVVSGKVDEKLIIDRGQVLGLLSVGRVYTLDDVFSAWRYVLNPECGSWSSQNDYFSKENMIKQYESLKRYEDTAHDLGIELDFDKHRSKMLAYIYDNKSLLSKEDFRALTNIVKQNYNSKFRYYKTRFGRILKKCLNMN